MIRVCLTSTTWAEKFSLSGSSSGETRQDSSTSFVPSSKLSSGCFIVFGFYVFKQSWFLKVSAAQIIGKWNQGSELVGVHFGRISIDAVLIRGQVFAKKCLSLGYSQWRVDASTGRGRQTGVAVTDGSYALQYNSKCIH